MKEKRIEKALRSSSGFTLVEMLLVVVIIGVLTAVVAGNFGKKSTAARINATRASISAISSAVEVYQMDMGRYPSSLDDLITNPGGVNWDGPYVKGGKDKLVDAWGQPFSYKKNSGPDFKVISAGEDGSMGSSDDITN
jgi:general secretion pathway protein G